MGNIRFIIQKFNIVEILKGFLIQYIIMFLGSKKQDSAYRGGKIVSNCKSWNEYQKYNSNQDLYFFVF